MSRVKITLKENENMFISQSPLNPRSYCMTMSYHVKEFTELILDYRGLSSIKKLRIWLINDIFEDIYLIR